MTKIRVILQYFGKLPTTFRFWLSSCHYNRTIDWMIVTDADVSIYPKSENVQFIPMDFATLRERIQSCFPFPISMERPYKLCDFKPFGGVIWKDYLVGYDFWGYCDCDLVFGDIRFFATESLLAGCDRYLGHGHFSLIRNDESFFREIVEKTLSRRLYNYRHVLASPEAFAFDEYDHYGITYTYQRLRPDRFVSGYDQGWTVFDDVDSTVDHFRDLNKDPDWRNRTLVYRFSEGKLERVFVESREIRFEETLYLHMMSRRMEDSATGVNQFFIVPDRFIPYVNNLTKKFFATYKKRFWDRRKFRHLYLILRGKIRIRSRLRALKNRGAGDFV